MELTFKRSDLAAVVKRAGLFTTEGALPILSMVRFAWDGQRCQIEATDLVRWYQGVISCEASGSESIAFLVPARVLKESLTSVQSDTLSLIPRDDEVLIRSDDGRYEVRVKTLPANEFPELKLSEPVGEPLPMTGARFWEFLRIAASVGRTADGSRPGLRVARLEFFESGYRVVATDTHRLVICKMGEADGEVMSSHSIPVETAVALASIASDELLEIHSHKEHIMFVMGDERVITQVITAEFPKYRRVVPNREEATIVWRFVREDLIHAIQSVKVGFDDIKKLIFEPSEDQLILKTKSSTVIAEAVLSARCILERGKRFAWAMNPDYLLAVLRSQKSNEIDCYLIEPLRAVQFVDEAEDAPLWVVMPMAL